MNAMPSSNIILFYIKVEMHSAWEDVIRKNSLTALDLTHPTETGKCHYRACSLGKLYFLPMTFQISVRIDVLPQIKRAQLNLVGVGQVRKRVCDRHPNLVAALL